MQHPNPVAIITGSSRGIGRAIAEKLGLEGYSVVINYVSRSDSALEVVAEIERAGGQAIAIQASVGDADQRKRLIAMTLEKWGRIDLLVNNAGITSPGRKDLLESTPEDWDLVFDTNLKGPFFLSQLVGNEMSCAARKDPSRRLNIINISSVSSYAVSENRADYCIAKAGMQMMTLLFATRLAEYGVGVFEICPGVIETDMTSPVKEKYDQLIEKGLTPIRRWGTPSDVALAVTAIAKGSFPFSTGERINVDGGFHIRRL